MTTTTPQACPCALCETAPCLDCGKDIHYLTEPWCAVDGGGVCGPCGQVRYGANFSDYLY